MRNSLCLLCILCMVAAACGKADPVKKTAVSGNPPAVTGIPSDPCVIYPAEYEVPIRLALSSDDASDMRVFPGEGLAAEVTQSGASTWTVEIKATESLGSQSSVSISAVNDCGETIQAFDVVKASLDVQTTEYVVPAAGASLSVIVSSNLCYTASSESTWINLEANDAGYCITAQKNSSFESRSAEIQISDSNGLLTSTVLVVQDAAIDYSMEERAALVALWNATGGESWKQVSSTVGGRTYSTSNWNTDASIDTWYGVTVNSDGHVIFIHLTGMGLTGTIPEEIGYMPWLQELWLGGNELTGNLPSSLANLRILKDLDLSGNRLSGDLEGSSLSGIASHLSCLSLSGNLFTGAFPGWVADMPEDANFWLQGNCLDGIVPESVKAHPRWNEDACDGTGRTIGEINMDQREGYVLR